MRYLSILAALFLAACGEPADTQMPDQCMRREIFRECMAALPKGPDQTVTNDWAEVVDECEDTAYYQSMRRKSKIKPECQP